MKKTPIPPRVGHEAVASALRASGPGASGPILSSASLLGFPSGNTPGAPKLNNSPGTLATGTLTASVGEKDSNEEILMAKVAECLGMYELFVNEEVPRERFETVLFDTLYCIYINPREILGFSKSDPAIRPALKRVFSILPPNRGPNARSSTLRRIHLIFIKYQNEYHLKEDTSDTRQLLYSFYQFGPGPHHSCDGKSDKDFQRLMLNDPRFQTLAYLMKKSGIIEDPAFGATEPPIHKKRKLEEILSAEIVDDDEPETKKSKSE